MTESSTVKSTEKSGDDKPESDPKKQQPNGTQQTVPVGAIGQERAQKRAARDEAEAAKTALAQLQEGSLKPDDIQAIVDAVAAESRKQLEAELGPWKQRTARAEMAMQFGLSQDQADKVLEVKAANPNLTDPQAILLARNEHQDIFQPPQQAGWNRGIHGGFPVSGASESRNAGGQPDYLAKMREAEQKGDRVGAMHFAKQEALQRIRDKFLKSRPLA